MMKSQDDFFFNEPPYEPLSWWESWTSAIFKPSVATFERIANDPQASILRAGLWVFFGALIGMFISVPLSLAFNPDLVNKLQQLTGEIGSALTATVGLMLCVVPLSAIFSVVGMIISGALIQLVARLLGGQGTLEGTLNGLAAITAPLTPVSALLGTIPVVGGCLALPLSLYILVLNVMAVKASNRFGWGAAVAAVLLPGLVIGGLCCCVAFALASAIGVALPELLNQSGFTLPQP
jgi:hypothetical protein